MARLNDAKQHVASSASSAGESETRCNPERGERMPEECGKTKRKEKNRWPTARLAGLTARPPGVGSTCWKEKLLNSRIEF